MSDTALDDALVATLESRGFELWASVRLVSFGRRKLALVKRLRERVGGLDYIRARQIVNTLGVALVDAPIAEARALADAIAEIGGQATIQVTHANRYAFSPASTERAAQRCWRVQVRPNGVELRAAQLGGWAEVDAEVERLPLTSATLDALSARWSTAGLREAGSELDIVLALSERNESLEDQFRASQTHEDQRREATVYADWLDAHGDPRGSLGSLQRLANTDDARVAEFQACVSTWAPQLLGPFHRAFDTTKFGWTGPFVTDATLSADSDVHGPRLLESTLALPVMAGLRRLDIGQDCSHHPALGELLDQAACSASLRELIVRSSRPPSLRGAALPQLRELFVATNTFPVIELHAIQLRRLHVFSVSLSSERDIDACLAGLHAPRLEHLHLQIEIDDHWDQFHGPFEPGFARLLALPSFTRLHSLILDSGEDSVPLRSMFASVLLAAPGLARLESIDLSKANLAPATRAQLHEARARLPGLKLP